eukprot:TRINITY_DN4560_c0_g1_i2.p1 TRINITY_DN4560_c0_g1~~TRINITY_DN4560_c0_g1_i2.p1  ORF type:complete len:141 (-),score=9.62 TRINITY_DN4560_c0_g1_i2:58-480(-)
MCIRDRVSTQSTWGGSARLERPNYAKMLHVRKPSSEPKEDSVSLCLTCLDKAPTAVFLPCGHGGLCYDCGLNIWKRTGECYLCRQKICQLLEVDIKTNEGNMVRVHSSTLLEEISNEMRLKSTARQQSVSIDTPRFQGEH